VSAPGKAEFLGPGDVAGALELLPRDIQAGDLVRVWDLRTGGFRWAEVLRAEKKPAAGSGRGGYLIWFEGVSGPAKLTPRNRKLVRRDLRAWPEWRGTPPCDACGEPARLVNGTGVSVHADDCPKFTREKTEAR
jgi:hypothetical protein